MNWLGLVRLLVGLLKVTNDRNEVNMELDGGFRYAAAIDLRCLLCPTAKRDRAIASSALTSGLPSERTFRRCFAISSSKLIFSPSASSSFKTRPSLMDSFPTSTSVPKA
eukprot:Gb_27561 [translate_table: standard]